MSNGSKALLIVLLITPLFGLGIDLYSPSMPAIANQFNVPETTIKLTIILYIIGYGIGQMIFGPMSDWFGRKSTLIIGLSLYVGVSVFLCFTITPLLFLMCRFMQGFLISSAGVINKTLLSDNFKDKNLEKATAYMVIIWSISPIVAPAIGSYVQAYLSWRVNFFILAGYGLISLILTKFILVDNLLCVKKISVKKVFNDYVDVISHKKFVGFSIILAITYALLVVFSIAAPFIIQTFFKQSVLVYGHLALLMGCGFFAGTMFNRVLINHFSAKTLIYSNLIFSILVAAFMVMWNIIYGVSIYSIGVPSFLIIFFSAIVTPNCYALSFKLFTEKAGTATAVRGVLTLIGASIFSSPALLLQSNLNPWVLSVEYAVLNMLALFIFYFILSKNKQRIFVNSSSRRGCEFSE